MAVVVDTNIISYIFKEDSRAALYDSHLLDIPKFISFMSLAELRRWQKLNNWGNRKIQAFDELLSDFGVVHSDDELCKIWRK